MRGKEHDAGLEALRHTHFHLAGVLARRHLHGVACLHAQVGSVFGGHPEALHVVFARDGVQGFDVLGHGMGVDALLAAHDGELAALGRHLARNPADHRIEAGLAHLVGFELELARRRFERGHAVLEVRVRQLHHAFLLHLVKRHAHGCQLRLSPILGGELEILAHAARFRQAVEDLVARPRFGMDLLQGHCSHADVVLLTSHELRKLQALQVRDLGQHVVGLLSRLGHLHVDGDHEVGLFQSLGPLLRLRVALRRVRVVEEQALDLTLERRLQRSHVGAGAGQDQRVLRIADALGSGLRGRLEAGVLDSAGLRRGRDQRAALRAPAAQKRVDGRDGARRLERVLVRTADDRAPTRLDGSRRSRFRHGAGKLLDGLGRDVGDLLGPLGRVLLGLLGELLEAVRVLLHEIVVVEVFLDEHVRHCHEQRQVGAGVDGHPVAGEDAGVVEARVDDDHAGAVLGGVGQALHRRGTDAVAVAAADEHDHLRIGEVVRIAGGADGQLVGALLRQVARRRVRVHVRRTQRVHEAGGVLLARRTRILDDSQRFRPVLGDDVLHLRADLLERGVPVDGLEGAVVLATQRLRDPLVGVRHLGKTVAAPADASLRVRMDLVALERPELAVHRRGDKPALAGTTVAQRRGRGRDRRFGRCRALGLP